MRRRLEWQWEKGKATTEGLPYGLSLIVAGEDVHRCSNDQVEKGWSERTTFRDNHFEYQRVWPFVFVRDR